MLQRFSAEKSCDLTKANFKRLFWLLYGKQVRKTESRKTVQKDTAVVQARDKLELVWQPRGKLSWLHARYILKIELTSLTTVIITVVLIRSKIRQ